MRKTNWQYRHNALLAGDVLRAQMLSKEIQKLVNLSEECVLSMVKNKWLMENKGVGWLRWLHRCVAGIFHEFCTVQQ